MQWASRAAHEHEDGSTTLGNGGGTGCRERSASSRTIGRHERHGRRAGFRFETGNRLVVSVPPLLLGGVRDVDGTPTLGLIGPGFDGAFRLVKDGT